MFYITMNEGVNAGLIYMGRILDFAEHPEFGHAYPRLHHKDEKSGPHIGCQLHGYCYEAIASAARIRQQWGCPLEELAAGHDAWDIIGYYIAQLCLAGHAVFAPERIVLGGSILWGADPASSNSQSTKHIKNNLIPSIRNHYIELRAGFPLGEAAFGRQVRSEELAQTLIRRGSIHRNVNGLGALELARQSLLPDLRLVKQMTGFGDLYGQTPVT